MKKPLKQAVQEQINSISLDEQQLEKLMQMQAAAAVSPEDIISDRGSRNTSRYWFMAALAMVLVLTLSLVLVSNRMLPLEPEHTEISYSMIQKIANEVAGNHLKMKPMEVTATRIDEVQRYFTQLDFLPQQSQQLASLTQNNLAGGRYCSIQGSTAAQLRYRDKDGGYVTLFETHYTPELFKQLPDVGKEESPIVTYARGIKVTMWVEHGLLMVSTEKPE